MQARDHYRAHGRRRVDLVAVLRDYSGSHAQGARVKNIGLGGACVELSELVEREVPRSPLRPLELSDSPWEVDLGVLLEVTAPTLWDPLTLRARVAWAKRAGGRPLRIGLRFEHHEAASLYALFQLLGAHAYDL